MDILFALVLAVIGMGVVLLFLGALVLILIGLKYADDLKERLTNKGGVSAAPRTKVATTMVGGRVGKKPSKADAKKEEEELRHVLAAAVSAYLLLKEHDALKLGDKRRRRNVWSTAGKYEMFQQSLSRGGL